METLAASAISVATRSAEAQSRTCAWKFTDWLGPAAKRPTQMLRQWSDDLVHLLAEVRPTAADSILVNTGDDFALLALAHAMKRAELPPLRIDVLFHFALHESGQGDRVAKSRLVGRQIRAAMEALRPHQVHLHATTDALSRAIARSGKWLFHSLHSLPDPSVQLGQRVSRRATDRSHRWNASS